MSFKCHFFSYSSASANIFIYLSPLYANNEQNERLVDKTCCFNVTKSEYKNLKTLFITKLQKLKSTKRKLEVANISLYSRSDIKIMVWSSLKFTCLHWRTQFLLWYITNADSIYSFLIRLMRLLTWIKVGQKFDSPGSICLGGHKENLD